MDMTPLHSQNRWLSLLGIALATLGLCSPCLRAQAPSLLPDFNRQPQLPRNWTLPRLGADADSPTNRPARFLLFGMPTGYLKDPVGLDLDAEVASGAMPNPFTADAEDDGFNWLQVTVGSDNPFFDFRRPGDPGGVGYYRMSSQLQLLDTGKTGLNVTLGAAAPAGLESDGVATGPTFFSPALACYQELGDGTMLQAFVGKHLRANSRFGDGIGHSIQYGVAAQHPLPDLPFFSSSNPHHGLFVFVEALGQCRTTWDDRVTSQRSPLELLPGLHLRMTENWWISGGLVVPMFAPRTESHLWQLTCSWRF
jgi:hypothetical protein